MPETLDPAPLELKFAGEPGEFTGYAATFNGASDRKGDTISPGAFRRSLLEHKAAGGLPPLLWQHDADRPVGAISDMHEDARGLRIEGRIIRETKHGAEAYALAKAGGLALSIGFVTRQSDRTKAGRVLTDLDLAEVSLVSVPADRNARILHVKGSNMDDLETTDAPAIPAIDTKRLDAIDATLAKLAARCDKIEVRANRPGVLPISAADAGEHERKAFVSFLRHGAERMPELERKDLVVSVDTAGGYLAPDGFIAELQRNLVLTSPIRQLARVTQISSAAVTLPKRTAKLSGGWVGEVSARPESQPAYGQNRYEVREMAVYTDVSNQLLEDSAIDIAAELARDFAEDFGYLEGVAFLNGAGPLQPEGIMTNASIPITVSGDANLATVAGLIKIFHDLPAPYRRNAVWLMNSTTLGTLRQLTSASQLVLFPSQQIGDAPGGSILGRPVVEAPDLDDVGAGKFPVLFGDFSQGYRIFDRVALSVLRDPYSQATNGLTRFHARRRLAAGVAKAEAIRKLKIAAA